MQPRATNAGVNEFYSRVAGQSEAGKRMERNRVQERILPVAEDRCNAYKQYLCYDQKVKGAPDPEPLTAYP